MEQLSLKINFYFYIQYTQGDKNECKRDLGARPFLHSSGHKFNCGLQYIYKRCKTCLLYTSIKSAEK